MTHRNKKILATLIVLAIISLSIVGIQMFNRYVASASTKIMQPIPVTSIRPLKTNLRSTLEIPGILESESVAVVFPRVPGIITNVAVQEGWDVTEGDILAELDSEKYHLEVLAAESMWKLAERSLERVASLQESSGTSLQKMEEAQAERDTAFSRYNLALMQESYTQIRSPISGTVLNRNADPGNSAGFESALFVIGDQSNLRIRTRLPEKYWDDFHENTSTEVMVRHNNATKDEAIPAKITSISPNIAADSKTFTVICQPDRVHTWPIGSQLIVEFSLNEYTDVWTLPTDSRTYAGNFWRISLDDLTAHKVITEEEVIEVGEMMVVPNHWSEDVFVLYGGNRLYEGAKITVVENSL